MGLGITQDVALLLYLRLTYAATGPPPSSELHPMRVLFLTSKDPLPRLEGKSSACSQHSVTLPCTCHGHHLYCQKIAFCYIGFD